MDGDFSSLEIKKSTIPGAGLGVFATKDIPVSQIVCEYGGFFFAGKGEWMYHDTACRTATGYIVGRNIGSMINDCIDFNNLPSKHEGFDWNLQFVSQGDKVFMISTRAIAAGEELFVPYGLNYWEHKNNNRL